MIYDTEDLDSIRSQTRRFVEEKVLPEADQWERDGRVPREILKEMGEIGFFGLRVPEEWGGVGMGTLATVAYAEELGRSTFGGFSITALVHTDLAMPYLLKFGSDEQKQRWLPSMLTGETFTAIAVTEPDAGSDVSALRTRAVRDGDGWRINGTKMFITNGGIADLVFVGVRTNPETKGSQGLSIVAVPKGTKGFSVSRALPKMGWHCSDTAELSFDDCWVPNDHLIGAENRGFYYIMENFQNERMAISAQALGETARALEITVAHVKERQAFGKPLFEKQAIRQRLALDACAARVRPPAGLSHRLGDGTRGGGREGSVDGQSLGGRTRQRRALRLCSVSRRHGLHHRNHCRASLSRRSHSFDRRRRHRSDARRGRQAALSDRRLPPCGSALRCGRHFANRNQTHTCRPLSDLDQHFVGKERSSPADLRRHPGDGVRDWPGDRAVGEDSDRLAGADELCRLRSSKKLARRSCRVGTPS